MISSVTGTGGAMPPPPMQQSSSQALSDDQKTTIADILADYDSDNLTAETASSLVDALTEAGIQPGAALAEELADAGFDAREIGDLAGVGSSGQQPPPPPSGESTEISSEQLTSIADYLDSLIESGTIDLSSATRSEDIYALLAEKFGMSVDDSLIDISV